ncbi:MAG: hydrogen peroxide-dependent heme synthase [Candidatus Eremiobacterota bacterium]
MATTTQQTPQAESTAPSTLEGAFLLHQMFRVDWRALSRLSRSEREALQKECAACLSELFLRGQKDESGGAFRSLGHKGDILLVHLRQTPDELLVCERRVAELELSEFLSPTGSYLSVVELSLHGAADRHRARLEKAGLNPGTPEWEEAAQKLLEEERTSARPRLYPELPATRYLCFYPMSKRRGELKNWFTLTAKERGQLMVSHGKIGRKYAGRVTQIISSSIGFDDYDWGVDLFSDDPVAFKKLIYEMRFDEVSAVYAEFGPFMLGVRTEPDQLFSSISG